MDRAEHGAARRPTVVVAVRGLVAVVTSMALVATVLAAIDARHARPAAATEALEDGKIDCGFGLFCGNLDLGVAPPTTGGQFLYQVVQPNTPEEIAAGEPDSAVAWASLETEAKAAVSALYGVPNDRRIVEAAREDVVSYMYNRLLWLLIAKDDGVAIEPYEQAWLDHLAGELQRKRVRDAQSALAEYDRWESDPCNFDPPAGYGFDPYSPICVGLGGQVQPAPPFAEQFTEYGAAIVNSQVFGDADVEAGWNKVAELASLAASVVVAGVASVITANVIGATATTTGLLSKIFPYAARAGLEIIRTVGAGAGGTLAFILAIAAAVTAAGTWREIETQSTLPKLQLRLATEQSTIPDLTAILDDPDQMTEAFGILFAETLPSFDDERLAVSTPRPHDPESDPVFQHADGSTTPTVATVDWDGRPQVTYLADGWFATSIDGGPYEWSPQLRYRQPDGRKATATRNNDRFVLDILPLDDSQLRVTIVSAGFADVTAVAGNRRPTVEVLVTDDLYEGSELTFEAVTSDADGDDVTVTWFLQPEGGAVTCIDLITGEANPWVCPWPALTGATVNRQYLRSGDYYGRVVVVDEHGAFTEQRFGFRVRNVAPEVTVDTPVAATEETGTATISGTFSDPGADYVRVTIDWGDGTSSVQDYPCLSAVAADGSCSPDIFGSTARPTSWFRTHVYADPPPAGQASYTVTVTVMDDGASVVRTVQQPVTPMPLTIPELTATDAPEGGTMHVAGRILNPSLDPLVLTVDFGDGLGPASFGYPCAPNSVCPFSPTPPAGGLFICQNPCVYVWFGFDVPVADDPAGADDTRTVSAKVRKEMTGFLDTATDTATISNVAPTLTVDAVPSVVAGAETVVTGSVSDPGADTGMLTVDWGDGLESAMSQPLAGTFELGHVYGSPGLRTVTVQAVDDDGGASAAITRSADVTPAANHAPVTVAPASPLGLSEDGSLQIDLGDFIDSDDLTPVGDLHVAATDPAHGSLSGTGFVRTYTPDANYHGSDSFDLTVTDGGSPTGCSPVGPYCLAAASSTVTVPLAVASVNDVPVVELSGAASADEGDTVTFTYALSDADGVAGGSVEIGCGAAGVLTWSGDGSFACTFPDGSASSAASVTFTDADGASDADSVTVAIANVAPTLQTTVSPASLVALPNETVTIAGSFTDPGDDSSTVTVTWGDGSTTALPAQAPGTFQGTHSYAGAGSFTITVTVNDAEDSSSASYEMVVAAGAAAVEAIAARLADAPTDGLTLLQRRALQRAIDRLIGGDGGAGVGAADELATDPVAGLDKIKAAVEQLTTVPLEVAAVASRQLAELSRTVAVNGIAAAKARTGCTSYALPTCSGTEAKALGKADAALAAGDAALAARDNLGAIGSYRDATYLATRA